MTVKQLREFILWLRKERIGYTTLTAGGVTLDGVVDGKLERGREAKAEPRKTWIEHYGDELLKASAVDPNGQMPDEEPS